MTESRAGTGPSGHAEPQQGRVITALREHPRRAGRYEALLDGEERLPLSLELIAELKLRVGRRLSAGECEQLRAGARQVECYDKALGTLGARARSTADLRRYLRTKGFAEAQVGPAVEKLTQLRLLDDLEYARTFARARLAPSRGFGPRRVAAELARKGVARGVVERVMAEERETLAAERNEALSRGDPLVSSVREAAEKKRRTLVGLDPQVAARRLSGYLARRGFSWAEIAEVLRDLG